MWPCKARCAEEGVYTCTEEECNCEGKPSMGGVCGHAKEDGKECQCAARELGKCVCFEVRGGKLNADGSYGCEGVIKWRGQERLLGILFNWGWELG